MRKLLILLAAVIALALAVLSGCTMEQIKTENNIPQMFMRYQNFDYGQVIVDRETRVMYWVSHGKNNYGTLTLLVNQDGSPKVLEGDLQ